MSKSLSKSRFIELFGNPTINEKGFPLLTVDDVIKFEGGSQPNKAFFEYEKTENNIRLIQIRDYKTDEYITYIPKDMAKRLCSADDIMIGRYGPPIFQILQGIEGAYNVALMKAIPKKGNKDFIRSWLKQDCLLKYLEALSGRTAGQDGIQMDKLKAYPFPYPPIELQDQWVKIDKQIDKSKFILQKMIEKLELLKKSRFIELFSESPKARLADTCKLINGDRGKNYPSSNDRVESGIPFINAGNLNGKNIDFSGMEYITEEKYSTLKTGKVQKGDILYCLRGSLGKIGLVDFDEGLIASSLVIIRCDQNKLLPDFLLCALGSNEVKQQLLKANNGSSQPNLSAASVKEYKVTCPSINEQKEFSEFIKQIDKSKLILQKQLDDLVGETK